MNLNKTIMSSNGMGTKKYLINELSKSLGNGFNLKNYSYSGLNKDQKHFWFTPLKRSDLGLILNDNLNNKIYIINNLNSLIENEFKTRSMSGKDHLNIQIANEDGKLFEEHAKVDLRPYVNFVINY